MVIRCFWNFDLPGTTLLNNFRIYIYISDTAHITNFLIPLNLDLIVVIAYIFYCECARNATKYSKLVFVTGMNETPSIAQNL